MNEKELATSIPTSYELLSRLNEVCEKFEQAWQKGDSPSIKDFLSGFQGDERSKLFGLLLELDVDYRRRSDSAVTVSWYVDTFPDLKNSIEEVFESFDRSKKSEATLLPEKSRIAERYLLEEMIGQGGMGAVWKASQTEPVTRTVAIKLIRKGLDSSEVLQRFEAERQALAMMDHPNIATVLDAGTTEDHQPFFVMEYVDGQKITRYCSEYRTQIGKRLELFLQVCGAIQHAHRKGIIHRDIKPTNVLVAAVNDQPIPKVIDFGVAKAMSKQLTKETMQTEVGHLLGTPEYMSPEQADFTEQDIDTRSDVYSLGVLLFEMISGTTPIDCRNQSEPLSVFEILRQVREEDAPRLSQRLIRNSDSGDSGRKIQDCNGVSLHRVKRELDWIIIKALEKDRENRYQSVSELAEDVDRFVRGEPIEAHPPSTFYRLRKMVARNKVPVIASCLLVLSLIAGMVGTSWGMLTARRQTQLATQARDELQKALEIANENSGFALGTLNSVVISIDDALKKTPGMSGLRREILKHIYNNLDQFSTELMDQDVADFAVIQTHLNLAKLFRRIGDEDGEQSISKAENHLNRAMQIATKLYQRNDHSMESSSWLALAAEQASLHFMRVGKLRQAELPAKVQLDLREDIVRNDPDNKEKRFRLIVALFDYGTILSYLDRNNEAEPHFRRMSKMLEGITNLPELPVHIRQAQAGCHHSLSEIAMGKGQFPEAIEQAQKALVIVRAIAEDYPDDARSMLNVAEIETALGNIYFHRRKYDLARNYFEMAVKSHKKGIDGHPDRLDLLEQYAEAHTRLGDSLIKLKEPDGARPILENAIKIITPICKGDPDKVWAHGTLAEAHELLAEIELPENREKALKHLKDSESVLQASPEVKRHFSRELNGVRRRLNQLMSK